MLSFSEDITIENVDFYVEGKYIPGRRAPDTANRDSIGYSDPGDGLEIDELSIYIGDQEISEMLNENTLNAIYERIEEILGD